MSWGCVLLMSRSRSRSQFFYYWKWFLVHNTLPFTSFHVPLGQPHSSWYYSFTLSFQLCINQFANKICRVGGDKIWLVGLSETHHDFFKAWWHIYLHTSNNSSLLVQMQPPPPPPQKKNKQKKTSGPKTEASKIGWGSLWKIDNRIPADLSSFSVAVNDYIIHDKVTLQNISWFSRGVYELKILLIIDSALYYNNPFQEKNEQI